MGGGEGALEVHIDHCVEVLLGHREDHAVAQDSRVVDQDVEAPPGVDGLLDHLAGCREVGDIGSVDQGLASHGLDLGHHLLGRAEVPAGAVHVTAQVVDDDLGALAGQHQGVFPSDAPSSAGDDGHPAVTEVAHDWISRFSLGRGQPATGGAWRPSRDARPAAGQA